MYVVEKIGDLILISLEGDVQEEEIEDIKAKLGSIAKVANDDVVVSFNLAHLEPSVMTFQIQQRVNDLLRFCHLSGLRVYSYSFK